MEYGIFRRAGVVVCTDGSMDYWNRMEGLFMWSICFWISESLKLDCRYVTVDV